MDKLDKFYMNVAIETSKLSYCKRGQVGAIAVKSGNIIGFGYNGTLSGHKNCCEELIEFEPKNKKDFRVFETETEFLSSNDNEGVVIELDNKHYEKKTKVNVLHAEQNLICKCARDGTSLKDSTVYCTLMPCEKCASLLIQSGVTRICVKDDYRCSKGKDLILKSGITLQFLV